MEHVDLDPSLRLAVEKGTAFLTIGYEQKVVADHVLAGAALISFEPFVRALRQVGIDPNRLVENVRQGFRRQTFYGSMMEADPNLRECMQRAIDPASGRIGLGAVLLEILRKNPPSLVLKEVQAQGVRIDALIGALETELRQSATTGDENDDIPESLRPFVIDMVALAAGGKYPPVVGRDEEIAQVLVTLAQRYTPNPILIGNAGVGKTAIVEEIARRIASDDIPSMRGVRVLSVSIGGAVGGTMLRGQFEQRIQDLIAFCRRNPNVVLFIDEAHMIVGAGNALHAADAANMLKTAMDRGDIRAILATTPGEYQVSIENDAALARRVVPVHVGPPSHNALRTIMRAQAQSLSDFHRVTIRPDAIETAIRLSRFMVGDNPSASVAVLDRAAARASVFRRSNAGVDIEAEIAQALANGDVERATRLFEQLGEGGAERPEERPVVTSGDIVNEVAQATGIAPELLDGRASDLVDRVDRVLRESIIGQPDACDAIVRALSARILGVSSDSRPIGAFLFVGPSGVGKTETAHALAQALFGDSEAVLKIDMAGLHDAHAMSSLLGAPPGFVGYDQPTPLDAIRRRPYQVVLLDEVEKASPAALLAFLNALDCGSIQMANGKSVDVRNCIFIMTSNAGTGYQQSAPIGLVGDRQPDDDLPQAIKDAFRPELLGRLHAIVPFRPLTQEHLADIARLMVRSMAKRLADRNVAVDLQLSDRAATLLATVAQSPAFGARTMRTVIETAIGPKVLGLLSARGSDTPLSCVIDIVGEPGPAGAQRGGSARNVQAVIEMVKDRVVVSAIGDRSVEGASSAAELPHGVRMEAYRASRRAP